MYATPENTAFRCFYKGRFNLANTKMENDHTLKDKLDDYLLDRMSMVEREAFEKEMAESDQLRQDVELQRMIKDEISERASFFKIMECAEKQKTGRFIFFRSRTFYAIAASILILVTFFIWQPTKMSNEAIVAQYAFAIPIDDGVLTRGESDQIAKAECPFDNLFPDECQKILEAFTNYKNQEYEKARKLFEEVLSPPEKNEMISLFMAISQLKSGKGQLALETLQAIETSPVIQNKEQVKYFKALSFIAIGDKGRAKTLLLELADGDEYAVEANEIIKKLFRKTFFLWSNRDAGYRQVIESSFIEKSLKDLVYLSTKEYNSQNYTQSIKLAEYALKEIEEGNIVYDETDKIQFIRNIASAYFALEEYKKAEEYYLLNLENTSRVYGKESESYLSVLNGLAIISRITNNLTEAAEYYTNSLFVIEILYGEKSDEYEDNLYSLALIKKQLGRYFESLELFNEVLTIKEWKYGRETEGYFMALKHQTHIYAEIGDYQKAKIQAEEIVDFWKRNNNTEEYHRTLGDLASVYSDLCEFDKSIELQEFLLDQIIDEPQNYYAISNNLISDYLKIGDLKRAERKYQTTLSKFEGSEDYDIERSILLTNMAGYYQLIGEKEKVEVLYNEILNTLEHTVGNQHIYYATTLNNLGTFYQQIMNNAEAERLYLQAIEIIEESIGNSNLTYSHFINNLGTLYSSMENFHKANTLLKEALEIRLVITGEESLEYAESLMAIGFLYHEMKNYNKAEEYYLEAIKIREKLLGKENPLYIFSLKNLTALFQASDRFIEAKDAFMSLNEILMNYLKSNSELLSSTEKVNFRSHFYDKFTMAMLSFCLKVNSKELVSNFFNSNLIFKGQSLQGIIGIKQLSNVSKENELKGIYDKWEKLNRQVAYLQSLPLSQREFNVDSIRTIINSLEKEMIRESNEFENFHASFNIDWEDLTNSFSETEAGIEFIDFNYFNGTRWTDSTYYCALIVRHDSDHPEMVFLTEERPLEALLKSSSQSGGIDRLYASSRGAGTYSFGYASASDTTSLYELIWQPLDSLLKGIKTVYYSPSGLLHKVSHASISTDNPDNPAEMLMDKYQLNYVSSTRQVIAHWRNEFQISENTTVALFGGVDYEWHEKEETDTDENNIEKLLSYQYTRSSFIPYDTLRSTPLKYLPGTLDEVKNLKMHFNAQKIPTQCFTGKEATEANFKTISGVNSPEIIHLATHGFFFEQPENKPERNEWQMIGQKTYRYADDPLIRSGLLLAGANRKWSGGEIPMNMEDGILTALEISNLNLTNTKLVVLSACETGLGDIKGSEGVYGLQRAFKMAGVDFIVMSLWKVPDKETAEMMDLFYKKMLEGLAVREAFKNAQKVMRSKYSPYFWASFVLIE